MNWLREIRAFQRRRQIARTASEGRSLAALLRTETVFVHVPKCGGKTVISALYGLELHDYFGHADLAFYQAVLGPRKFSSFLKFATVRDPYARARSAFGFARAGGFGFEPDLEIEKRLKTVTWHDFVMSGLIEEFSAQYLIFRPQVSFLTGVDGRIGCDAVLPVSRLGDGLRRLDKTIPPDRIKVINASRKQETSPHEDEERKVVERIYRDDLALSRGELVPFLVEP